MSLLLLILSVHFLADFHLWPGSPDVKKHPCFRCLLPHFGMYSLVLGLESFCKIFGEMEKTGSSENRCGMNKLAGTECSQLTAGRYVISGIIVECKNVGYKVRQDNEHPRDDCTGK